MGGKFWGRGHEGLLQVYEFLVTKWFHTHDILINLPYTHNTFVNHILIHILDFIYVCVCVCGGVSAKFRIWFIVSNKQYEDIVREGSRVLFACYLFSIYKLQSISPWFGSSTRLHYYSSHFEIYNKKSFLNQNLNLRY